MILCAVITAVAAVILVLYLKEKIRAYSPLALMLKSAVSALFLATAVSAAFFSRGNYAYYIIYALVCGMLGDIWLDLKYVYPADDEKYTFAGFMAFGCGHIVFMAGMLAVYADLSRPGTILVPLLIGAVAGIVTGASGKLMKLEYGKFKTIVMVYGGLLFGMTVLAGSLALVYGLSEPTLNLMFIGGVLFALSDLILSGTYFGEGKDRPIDLIFNLTSYYAAQFVIAWAALFAK